MTNLMIAMIAIQLMIDIKIGFMQKSVGNPGKWMPYKEYKNKKIR